MSAAPLLDAGDLPGPDALPGGWHLAEVAAGQAELVTRELERPGIVEPYVAFQLALEKLNIWRLGPVTLLDVGCGVGHYGSLVRTWYEALPITYVGTDASAAMIEFARAREPRLRFERRRIEENDFGAADIVLSSLCCEMTADPIGNTQLILESAPGVVIWHRVRLAAESGFIQEPTYANQAGPIWLWKLEDALELVAICGRGWEVVAWPERRDHVTIICRCPGDR